MPNIADQYRTIESGAGLRRRVERGRLSVSGADRRAFLQALLTNDVAALAPGQGSYGAYLTPQGRMIADLHVFALENEIAADVPADRAAALSTALDNLIFTEQVQVADVSSARCQVAVVGGEAARVIARVLHLDAGAIHALPLWSNIPTASGFVARTDDARVASFDIVAPAAEAASLIELLTGAGAIEMSLDLWTALRIDAGRPEFGIDMDEDTIPLEAGLLDRAISTTKGCYVGQEVIIRVLHRGGGRVAKRLVKVAFPPAAATDLSRDATLRAGDREIGRITSASQSLDGAHAVALAYVHRDAAQVGHEVTLVSTALVRGEITSVIG